MARFKEKETKYWLQTPGKKDPTRRIDEIILNAQYTVLVFQGRSDGAFLQDNFNANIIRDKKCLIKSFRIIPYAFAESDVFFDNTNTVHYTVPAGGRLINVIDEFSTSTRINFFINGFLMQFFPTYIGNIGYPLDLFVDNIYYDFTEKVRSMQVNVNGVVITDLNLGTTAAPNIKVLVECYLY